MLVRRSMSLAPRLDLSLRCSSQSQESLRQGQRRYLGGQVEAVTVRESKRGLKWGGKASVKRGALERDGHCFFDRKATPPLGFNDGSLFGVRASEIC